MNQDLEVIMKDLLDQMEEHIAAIRNLQRNFDFHSKRLEKLMLALNQRHQENNINENPEMPQMDIEKI
jgi:hypothetical protein